MIRPKKLLTSAAATALLVFCFAPLPSGAEPTELNDIPMAVANQVKANFLVVLDNSQSMDGRMDGVMQSGESPDTRSNIGRNVLREVLSAYRDTFRWGLMSFDPISSGPVNIHAEYMGSDTGMVFTHDCVDGVSARHGGRRCVANLQSTTHADQFVTYDKSGDDPEILDVLYSDYSGEAAWGYTPPDHRHDGDTFYLVMKKHVGSKGHSWEESEFETEWFHGNFGKTDAGWESSYPTTSRRLFLLRGWGYNSAITGGGKLVEPVQADSIEHYNKLISALGAETKLSTPEIKNSAKYTPLAGTFDSAKNYFLGEKDWKWAATSDDKYSSPITASCQKNFVMLLTDGLPTGNQSGALYSEDERKNSCSAWNAVKTVCTGTWTGTAATETFTAVGALRSVPYTGCTDCTAPFDVQTYVIAMGNIVANATAVALMNRMASVGGTGKAFLATDAATLKNSVDKATAGAKAMTGAAAASAVTSANVTATTQSFQSTYYSGDWTGDLKSYLLDTSTGAPTGDPLWSAQERLDALASPVSSRKIVSYSGSSGTGQGIRFQPNDGSTTTLSEAQQGLVSTSDGAGIVNFLRGDRSGEKTVGDVVQKYRARAHLLGDIVNSEPVVVAGPTASYNESTDPGYAAFKAADAARTVLVFQGANDGMLHAFAADSGDEAWAYVPSLVLPALANLSLMSGFTHKYYVDGTPTVADVDFDRTGGAAGSGSPGWRTILVGGLGKGGKGFYALDITNGVPGSETDAAANVLWEFPNSSTAPQVVANLGYSFGRPVIAKAGDQGWVVLVSSGYNNTDVLTVAGATYTGDGRGHLFVLNARTGELIRDIPTGAGSTGSPSGLAAFSAYVEGARVDNTVAQVYGGDLYGNVWRFDLTGVSSGWNVAKLAALVDASGNPQPVTTAPELATLFESAAAYRFVYVGTGRYLGTSDVRTTATQTMYGLVDDRSASPLINPLRSNLQQQTLTFDGTRRSASANRFDLTGSARKRGWYVDLPVSGERISTDPQLAFGALVFTSNIPSLVDCVPGGSSYFNVLDYRTGGALAGTDWSSVFLGNVLASRPMLEQLESGRVVAGVRTSDGGSEFFPLPPPPAMPAIRRVSWRELPDSN